MATITVRNLDEDTKHRLRVRAAENGRSMEEEARVILRSALRAGMEGGLGSRVAARFAGLDGELELPARRDLPRPAPLPT